MAAHMPVHAWLSAPVIVAYLLSAVFYFTEVFFFVENASRRGRLLLMGAAALQGVVLLGHSIARGPESFASVFESANVVVWLVVVAFLIIERKAHIAAAGVFVTPLAFLISISMLAVHGKGSGSSPLHAGWLLAHIGVIVLGYAALALAVCFVLVYLTGERLLKSKHAASVLRYFPSLETADRLVVALTAFGLSMLTAGIVTGILGSYAQSESPWAQPRMVLSIVAWLMFALYLFVRQVMGWHGSRAKWVIVAGFAVLIITMISYRPTI